jgi:hypothetical protein
MCGARSGSWIRSPNGSSGLIAGNEKSGTNIECEQARLELAKIISAWGGIPAKLKQKILALIDKAGVGQVEL